MNVTVRVSLEELKAYAVERALSLVPAELRVVAEDNPGLVVCDEVFTQQPMTIMGQPYLDAHRLGSLEISYDPEALKAKLADQAKA